METLKMYLEHFDEEVTTLRNLDWKEKLFWIRKGLAKGTPFHEEISINIPRTVEEFLTQARKFMTYEEETQKVLRATPERGATGLGKNGFKGYTPLNKSLALIMKEYNGRYFKYHARPKMMQPGKAIPFKRWCHYHSSGGHDTNSCQTLRTKIEDLIQQGELQECVLKERDLQIRRPPHDHRGEGSKPSRKRKVRTEQEEKAYQQRLREPYGGYTSESSDESLRATHEAGIARKGSYDRASGRKSGLDLAGDRKTARKSVPDFDLVYDSRPWSYAEPVIGETGHPTRYVLQDR